MGESAGELEQLTNGPGGGKTGREATHVGLERLVLLVKGGEILRVVGRGRLPVRRHGGVGVEKSAVGVTRGSGRGGRNWTLPRERTLEVREKGGRARGSGLGRRASPPALTLAASAPIQKTPAATTPSCPSPAAKRGTTDTPLKIARNYTAPAVNATSRLSIAIANGDKRHSARCVPAGPPAAAPAPGRQLEPAGTRQPPPPGLLLLHHPQLAHQPIPRGPPLQPDIASDTREQRSAATVIPHPCCKANHHPLRHRRVSSCRRVAPLSEQEKTGPAGQVHRLFAPGPRLARGVDWGRKPGPLVTHTHHSPFSPALHPMHTPSSPAWPIPSEPLSAQPEPADHGASPRPPQARQASPFCLNSLRHVERQLARPRAERLVISRSRSRGKRCPPRPPARRRVKSSGLRSGRASASGDGNLFS